MPCGSERRSRTVRLDVLRRDPANQVRDVAIEVQYGFKPWISIVAAFVPNFVIKTVSVVQTEY